MLSMPTMDSDHVMLPVIRELTRNVSNSANTRHVSVFAIERLRELTGFRVSGILLAIGVIVFSCCRGNARRVRAWAGDPFGRARPGLVSRNLPKEFCGRIVSGCHPTHTYGRPEMRVFSMKMAPPRNPVHGRRAVVVLSDFAVRSDDLGRAIEGEAGRRSSSGAVGKRATPYVALQGRPVMTPDPMQEKADRETDGCLAPWSGQRRERTRHYYTVALSDVVHSFVATSEDGRFSAAVHSAASWPPHSPYYSARLLLERHGARAIVHAAKELADCQASGDGDGYAEWGEIADAIEDLQEH